VIFLLQLLSYLGSCVTIILPAAILPHEITLAQDQLRITLRQAWTALGSAVTLSVVSVYKIDKLLMEI